MTAGRSSSRESATSSEEYAATLSAGQRKLLELARALMLEPQLVLLDEPLAGVNPTLGRRLRQLLSDWPNQVATKISVITISSEFS